MTIKDAKVTVKNKYPRAVCGYYGCEQDRKTQKFAVKTYRCGEPITNTPSAPGAVLHRFLPVTFSSQGSAWVAAGEAVVNGTEGDLTR